jgi:hypothetical protein
MKTFLIIGSTICSILGVLLLAGGIMAVQIEYQSLGYYDAIYSLAAMSPAAILLPLGIVFGWRATKH